MEGCSASSRRHAQQQQRRRQCNLLLLCPSAVRSQVQGAVLLAWLVGRRPPSDLPCLSCCCSYSDYTRTPSGLQYQDFKVMDVCGRSVVMVCGGWGGGLERETPWTNTLLG